MSDQPEKVTETRISVTLTEPYLDAVDRLVEEGLYLSRGEAVLEGLNIIFRRHGLNPFRFSEGPPGEGGGGGVSVEDGNEEENNLSVFERYKRACHG